MLRISGIVQVIGINILFYIHLSPSYSLNSIIIVLQQGWLWYQITHEGWYAIKPRKRNQSNISL